MQKYLAARQMGYILVTVDGGADSGYVVQAGK